jgi:hypothetical protein
MFLSRNLDIVDVRRTLVISIVRIQMYMEKELIISGK